MTAERFDALACSDIPKFAGSINATSEAVVPGKVELTAGKLARVTLESVDALACTNVPNLGGVIEGTGE